MDGKKYVPLKMKPGWITEKEVSKNPDWNMFPGPWVLLDIQIVRGGVKQAVGVY